MVGNASLNNRAAMSDEWYTPRSTVENYLNYLLRYNPNIFRDARIHMPADNGHSAFLNVFNDRFDELGLKSLTAMNYSNGYSPPMIFSRYGDDDYQYYENEGGDGDMFSDPQQESMIRDADTIITNPPFSLVSGSKTEGKPWNWADILKGRKFAFLGNVNMSSYNNMMPYVLSNQLRQTPLSSFEFDMPDGSKKKLGIGTWLSNIGPRFYSRNVMQNTDVPKYYTDKDIRHIYNFSQFDPTADVQLVPAATALQNINPDYHTILGRPKTEEIGLIEDRKTGQPREKFKNFLVANNDFLSKPDEVRDYADQHPTIAHYFDDRIDLPKIKRFQQQTLE